MKRKILTRVAMGLALIAVAMAMLPHVAGWRATVVEYDTVACEKGTIRTSVSATGTVSALETVDVGTQVSGTISKIYVDFNDVVSKGQLLARIEETLFRADLLEAEGNFYKTKAQHMQKSDEHERRKKMYDAKLLSQDDLEAYEAGLRMSEGELTTVEAKLLRAQTNLSYTNVRAPVSGVIISRNVDEGQTVAANFATPTLFTIAKNLKEMRVLVDVDEADVGSIAKGEKVLFSVDAYPNAEFGGRVEEVRLEPKINQNVVTYTVVVNASNPELKLLPGMNAAVEIVVSEKTVGLKLPIAATTFKPTSVQSTPPAASGTPKGHATVWALSNGQPVRLDVVTGSDDGVDVEIASRALKVGSPVIVSERTVEPTKEKKNSLLPSPGGPR